jgi:hypothetical protein
MNNLYYQPLSILIAIISNTLLIYLKEEYYKSENILNIFFILILFINAILMNMILIDDNKYYCNENNSLSINKNNTQSQNEDYNSLSSLHINILLIIYLSIISLLIFLKIKHDITFHIFKSEIDNYIPILIFWLIYWIYIFIIKKIFKSY